MDTIVTSEAAYNAVERRVSDCWDRDEYAKAKRIARRARWRADQATRFGAMIAELAGSAERRYWDAVRNGEEVE